MKVHQLPERLMVFAFQTPMTRSDFVLHKVMTRSDFVLNTERGLTTDVNAKHPEFMLFQYSFTLFSKRCYRVFIH